MSLRGPELEHKGVISLYALVKCPLNADTDPRNRVISSALMPSSSKGVKFRKVSSLQLVICSHRRRRLQGTQFEESIRTNM